MECIIKMSAKFKYKFFLTLFWEIIYSAVSQIVAFGRASVKIYYLCGSTWRSAASGGSSCPRGSPASGGRCRSRSRRPFRGSPTAGLRCTVSPPCLRVSKMRERHEHARKKNKRIVKGRNSSCTHTKCDAHWSNFNATIKTPLDWIYSQCARYVDCIPAYSFSFSIIFNTLLCQNLDIQWNEIWDKGWRTAKYKVERFPFLCRVYLINSEIISYV